MEQTKKTGTTTVGVSYDGGVVLATEKKATMGYMVDGARTRKVFPIDSRIGITTAGSVGDIQTVVRYMRAETAIFRYQKGKPISVRAATSLLANILQGAKYYPYMGLFIVGGFDEKGPQVFSIDALGGVVEGDDYYTAGSGMMFALGVLEDQYKKGMTRDAAIKLAVSAVRAATKRDIASGGEGFNVSVIDEKGYRELSQKEIDSYQK